MTNQNPEQIARDQIDRLLVQSGWVVQGRDQINLAAASGVAIREYQTEAGPADYILFLEKKPVGLIEAKREEEGVRLTVVEEQSVEYATSTLKYLKNDPLPFVYESTGTLTRFTDYRDPKPRSRPVFTFHRPETFHKWLKEPKSLRSRFFDIPGLPLHGLRDCQIVAVNNLETSFRENRPKALVQMATGSGKTFTAITFIYRLLKFAKARRILFLVDTKNLGEQAEGEFKKYVPQDDNRLFPELHGVTRLSSAFIPGDCQVYISTIQRLYSILKGSPLDEREEEENPNEKRIKSAEPMPVVYSERTPMEFFDFIVIDECHRSIYNVWKQVLDYFDAFQIGLTATPDKRTLGYFNQNLVSDYGYRQAVEDGVLVPYNVFEIQTKITKEGAKIELGEYVGRREKLTRRQFWNSLDEDVEYNERQLDAEVVNPNQIRLIVRSVKEQLPVMFPDRMRDGVFEVPKTLIFAKSDSHADDIINIVREEFGEGNEFCKKITYRSEEDPKSVLQRFRTAYEPRIAVTVDMIATGTDIRPLEVLLFMRDVRSRTYYEQMKGRGTRTCDLDELRRTGSPAARFTKDHFVIIDAVGVERSQKTDSRPLERKPGLSLKQVLDNVKMGNRDEDLLTSLANRLIRLDSQISERERAMLAEKSGGRSIRQIAKDLLAAHDPDTIEGLAQRIDHAQPDATAEAKQAALQEEHGKILEEATAVFNNYELRNLIVDIRRRYDQIIDTINQDEIEQMGWVKENRAQAEGLVNDFRGWIEGHKDEIIALQIFYGQPYRRRELTYRMIQDLAETLRSSRPTLAPLSVWRAYEQLERVNGQPGNELAALVSLVRRICGLDATLTAFDKTVDRNFRNWAMGRHKGNAQKFNEEQMEWLRLIKDYIAVSFHVDREDFDLAPFNAKGGLGKMWQLFGEETDGLLGELNEVLAG